MSIVRTVAPYLEVRVVNRLHGLYALLLSAFTIYISALDLPFEQLALEFKVFLVHICDKTSDTEVFWGTDPFPIYQMSSYDSGSTTGI